MTILQESLHEPCNQKDIPGRKRPDGHHCHVRCCAHGILAA